jgi:hypothetical protein
MKSVMRFLHRELQMRNRRGGQGHQSPPANGLAACLDIIAARPEVMNV